MELYDYEYIICILLRIMCTSLPYETIYCNIVSVLPQYCRRTAAVLPQYCRRTAAVLPPYCRRTAVGILMYDLIQNYFEYSLSDKMKGTVFNKLSK